jgi:flagellar L-ring protein FlgH
MKSKSVILSSADLNQISSKSSHLSGFDVPRGSRVPAQLISRLFVCGLLSLNFGCASMGKTIKGWFGYGDEAAKVTRFSDVESVKPDTKERSYKRMTRRRFEDDAEIGATAGSLWVMEGQGAYLFAQNQMRMVGDILNVKIDGGPKGQLQSKVKVIQKLLDRLEKPKATSPTGDGGILNPLAKADGEDARAPASEPLPVASAEKPETASSFAVQTVPTRVVEQNRDGSYRVRGTQPFMIGKREYKVIVTGIVRPEDFNESGTDASKLLDAQFDIVSAKKGAVL